MKPTSAFRLKKSTKCLIALGKFTNQEQRNAFKAMMIQAQLESNVRVGRNKSDKHGE